MTIDSENVYYIAEAMHCFLTLNHEGQTSDKYGALCRSDFRPGRTWTETRCMATNDYFEMINDDNWEQVNSDLHSYLNNM